ncbi:M14 family zinc carboxypeptidase [Psychroserpens sp. BH13MA-6]
MRKITRLTLLLVLIVQSVFSQDKVSRIKITNPDQSTINTIASQGIDLSCGAQHDGLNLIIELSELEINSLDANNVNYTVLIDDLQSFYADRAQQDLPKAIAALNAEKAVAANAGERSISSVVLDNVIQYAECDEIPWVTPSNFNLGSMAGCLTYSEMKSELDDMYAYSQSNGLDIVSQKANASSTGQTTWGNPASTITNNGLTYSGQGTTRWNPETIWYVRITGNQSSVPENSKPQMLFTSMIHSREVSALMNNIFFMWYIIENYNTDPAIQELVDNNELYFVPVVNPDGLRWNEHLNPNGGGLQRKNLRPNTGGTGNTSNNRGVDLNRNFDYFWGINNIGSSGTQTSGTYRGPSPESEPETQIMVDFITNRNIKSAVWNHSFANSVPHPYGGVPSQSSGREDEYYRWHEEMTRYNRYLYGATIFYESNGLPDDWMMGGAPDNNGSTGSGQGIIATTPEHGGQGFWPTPSTIIPIAKQSMRISLGTAYYGGKYAKLHDLTQSNITTLTSNLDFGIERIGQTASNFTVTVTPISPNITSIISPTMQSGIAVLDQRNVSAVLQLDPSITANEIIAYNVTLANDDGVIYEANYEKYYQPSLLFDHNPDINGLTGWTQSGGWNNTTSDSYSGLNALSTGTYSNNATKTLTTTNSFDFSNSSEVLIQFYSKWDIERNYDFVEILGSPDGGSSWISLCGNYTKPNATSATTSHDNKSATYSNFQANSLGQVYDGDRMDHWVMEEIAIDDNYTALLNSNDVKIRFNFRTDALNVNENYSTTNDGFFIDDFKIISVNVPCQTTVPTGISVSNVNAISAEVSWNEVPSATYDLRYREIGNPTWIETTDIPTATYLLTGLSAATDYEVQVATRCISNTSVYSVSTNFTTTTPIPCTGNVVSTFPYLENFEADEGLWEQTTDDDINWTRDSGGTPSSNTGPSTGDGDTFYMYTEASGNGTGFPSKVANFESPCFDFTGKDNIQFTYSYHMFGGSIGSLRFQISLDNGASYITIDEYSSEIGNVWNQQTVDLSAYKDLVVKFRFNAITGADTTTGWASDIAIDNINVTADDAGSDPPVAVCQDITVQLDTTGNAVIVAADLDGGSTDDVGIVDRSIDIDTFNCSNIGTPVAVTLTVTDEDDQTDTCVATVTVMDEVIPEFVDLPADINLSCGNNQPTWTDPTAIDNCTTPVTPVRTDGTGLNSGDVFPVGTTVISYAVTDAYGNVNTGSFNVIVEVDNENPVAICQNIAVQLDATGSAIVTAAQINNGSTDNCGIASISLSETSFTCADEGDNNVTLTITDTNGNTDTCVAVVTVSVQDVPTGLNCWEVANYNYTTCSWDISGIQPEEPVATNCWDDYQFNTTTCSWENQGTEPEEPVTQCWETTNFNTTTCSWEITGTQPEAPTPVNCWDDFQFNNTTCAWENQGTEPVEPVAVNCWDDYQFNSTTCAWENQGIEPEEPVTQCWEITNFNTTTCSWEISGTQPEEPVAVNCWDDYQFNTTTCSWENQGTEPEEPVTQCWETTSFNTTTCSWEISGTQPEEPLAVNCWDDYQFNTITCTWENLGVEPVEPTGLECWESTNFNANTCAWEVSGTQPEEPLAVNCWDDYQFNTTLCIWENQGVEPSEPTGLIVDFITTTEATVTWNNLPNVTYDLRYREVGTTTWIELQDITVNTQLLSGLNPSTRYIVHVRSKCSAISTSEYSDIVSFTTLDIVLTYCDSQSNNATEEYIENVQLNTINNTSGSQNYSDFTSISTILAEGQTYNISVTGVWTGTVYNESYSVWIDYNNDGDFEDAGEQVFTQGNTQASPIGGSFTVPFGTSRETTRMRVSMKYNALPGPCETFDFGEVEDYSITLVGSNDLIYTSSAWSPYAPSALTATDNALILDGTYAVTDDVQINNMIVYDGAGITVEKAKSLTINGDLVSKDNVVLESDSDEYASLIVNNFVIGDVLYKRHVNTTAAVGGNDLVAPPVYGESFIDFRAVNPNILSNATNTLFLFGPFDKVTDTYVLYTNTETAPMEAGIGYRAASTDAGTFTFTGLVETGNVSVPIVNNGPTNPEWNLVGNPYPSYIDLGEFLLANNTQFDTQSAGIYGYDGDASNGWAIWNQAYADANPDAVITPGQGFLIASATNNGQIDFTPSMRRIGSSDDFILGRQSNSSEISHLQLDLYNTSEGHYKTDFYFTDNASNGMDFNYDASIYGDQAPSDFALYSHLLEENVGIDMAIQSLGFDALSSAVIPLGIHAEQGQQLTISISESTLPQNIEVYLEDTLNNSFTLLNATDYTITPTGNINSIGRYFLRFNEETLSAASHEHTNLDIFTTVSPRQIIVKGYLMENTKVMINDLQGRLIKTVTLDASESLHYIDMSSFSSGVYMVSVRNKFQQAHEKVVIK